MVSLDIQGLSEEGVQSFIHSYVDARQFSDNDSRLYAVANHASGKFVVFSNVTKSFQWLLLVSSSILVWILACWSSGNVL